jgi:hypothetical protein
MVADGQALREVRLEAMAVDGRSLVRDAFASRVARRFLCHINPSTSRRYGS